MTDLSELGERLLGVARYHQQHERYYARRLLQDAAQLRTHITTLRSLADRWSTVEVRATDDVAAADPRFRMAGCPDLNLVLGIPSIGVLFMEGEEMPRELWLLGREIEALRDDQRQIADWLTEKMAAAWERDFELPDDASWFRAPIRHRVLIATTLSGQLAGLTADVLERAVALFDRLDLTPAAIRADAALAAAQLTTVAELLDGAVHLVTEQSAALAHSDRGWSAYIEHVERELGGSDAGR